MTPGAAHDLVAGRAEPAFVIALSSARLLAANPHGAAWLGIAGETIAGHSLDAAMPAMTRLRHIALDDAGAQKDARDLGESGAHGVPATLAFWTRNGVRSASALVAIAADASGEPIAIVSLRSPPPGAAFGSIETPMDDDPEPRHSRDASQKTLPARDDAAILKEIARRIREGHTMRVPLPNAHQDAHKSEASGPAAASNAARDDGPAASLTPRPPDHAGHPDPGHLDPGHLDPGHPDQGAETIPGRRVELAKLAHELKTPLSAIAAAAEIMRDERLGPIENARYKSYASDIFDSARHALHVINNLLSEGSGKAAVAGTGIDPEAMVFTEIDLNAIALSCASSMRPLAEHAGIALTTDLAPRLPFVVVDVTTIRQIALNLLTNAVKFTARGGTVTLLTRVEPDGRVMFGCRDTGRGMSAADMARVDPIASTAAGSRQGSGAELSPTAGGGLGIGLRLVGDLARANGATVQITSASERGTLVAVNFAKDRVVPK